MAEIDVLNAIAALQNGLFPPLDYFTNPGLAADSNNDGLSDGLSMNSSIVGTPVCSRVAPISDSAVFAQRIQYTGVAGDAGDKLLGIRVHPLPSQRTGGASFSPGDFATLGVVVRGSLTGCTSRLVFDAWKSDGAYAGGEKTASVSIGAAAATVSLSSNACPALTDSVSFSLDIQGIGPGDLVDITIGAVQIKKGATLGLFPTAFAALAATLISAVLSKTANLPASPAAVGSAMALTGAERTSVATAVWASATRTLSGFGTLVADVWASATRALTDKTGFSGTATNMVAAAPSLAPVLDAIAVLSAAVPEVDLTPVMDALDDVLLKTNTIGGAGAISWPHTLTVNGMPCADAAVWVTTDEAGNNVVASGRTDNFGALVPVPHLDAGTYYFRAKKSGVNFEVDIEVVS